MRLASSHPAGVFSSLSPAIHAAGGWPPPPLSLDQTHACCPMGNSQAKARAASDSDDDPAASPSCCKQPSTTSSPRRDDDRLIPEPSGSRAAADGKMQQEQQAAAASAAEECYAPGSTRVRDCVFHVKFGRCKLGMNCRLNHPPSNKLVVKGSGGGVNSGTGDEASTSEYKQMDYTLLKDVTGQSHRWRIRVRVTRFSEFTMANEPDKILRLDLVLLDEKGDMMDAQIPALHVPRFKELLKEDNVYYIEYFQVIKARTQYRPVDGMVMAGFTAHTRVIQDSHPPSIFPTHACKILSFDELRSRADNNDVLSDTIGVMTAIGQVKPVSCGGVMKPVLNVHITDGRETAVVALWGPHAAQFHAEGLQQQAKQGPVVILFVGLTVKLRDNQLALQGNPMCRWYLNAPIRERISLINSLQGCAHEVRVIPQREAVHVKVSDISDLNPHEALDNIYTVKIAIKGLVPAEAWWYMACSTCKRSAFRVGNAYKCSSCSTNATETRYRIAIVGVDPSDLANDEAKTAEFIFFGEIGDQLIGVPVLNLVAAVRGARDIVPPEIEAVYGRQYIIRASVSPRSLQRIRISYKVDFHMPILPPDVMDYAYQPVPNHPTAITAGGSKYSDLASGSGLTIADKFSPNSPLHMLIQQAHVHVTTAEPGPASTALAEEQAYVCALRNMSPSTPSLPTDTKIKASPMQDQKRKSPACGEDLDQQTKAQRNICSSSPGRAGRPKASGKRQLFFPDTPAAQPPKYK